MLADETYDERAVSTTQIGRSLRTDYFVLRDELTEVERGYLKRTPRVRRQLGTQPIQTLIVGRDITGVGAFV